MNTNHNVLKQLRSRANTRAFKDYCKMKTLILTAILTISNLLIFGQVATVETDKELYEFEEIIEATFKLNAKFDSLILPEFVGLQFAEGPTKGSVFSRQDGETTITESRIFKFRPTQSGELIIPTLTYYIDGQSFEGDPIKIDVTPSNMTATETEEKKVQDFIDDGIKPDGTIRVFFFEDMGYIEVYENMGWRFPKRLTSREIKKLKKIK